MTCIWNLTNRLIRQNRENKGYLFLFFHTVFWTLSAGMIGFLVCLVFGLRGEERNVLMVCIAGYSGAFVGLLGGIVYLMRKL
ncbi:hypothetical protein MCG98_10375 [Ruminococcus sp. OA3]|uniref:hypothetical protein n=1 Tax=Ruminococcus sp. OA3 TaxID=2914164 RepID=UPI001F060963|nr:hypothetical protein [Ruminococcus sp. OA3]MCH1982970.1 hypothetical protein [Ruminococcus sp. OA3]